MHTDTYILLLHKKEEEQKEMNWRIWERVREKEIEKKKKRWREGKVKQNCIFVIMKQTNKKYRIKQVNQIKKKVKKKKNGMARYMRSNEISNKVK